MIRLNDQLHAHQCEAGLIRTLNCLAIACKDITQQLHLGAMAGILGSAGEENVQGETQKKLDVISNDLIKDYLAQAGSVLALASEEEDDVVAVNPDGEYLVAFDPLDGSSNIDINSMVGTIFSIYRAPKGSAVDQSLFLQGGRQQVAAGYVLYGPSAMLVLSTGQGVQMYTLDQRIGEFVQTEAAVQIAEDTKEFAINMSNQRHWAAPMQRYVTELLAGSEGPREKNFNMRWVAAMVADVHRILCRGGIFMYPWDQRDPNKPGKLRLLYEAYPMAMLVEQAGGSACTAEEPILDVTAEQIHQRVPVILGAKNEVNYCLGLHAQ